MHCNQFLTWIKNIWRAYSLFLNCIFFLYLQINIQPYNHEHENRLESFSLFILIILATTTLISKSTIAYSSMLVITLAIFGICIIIVRLPRIKQVILQRSKKKQYAELSNQKEIVELLK